MNSFILSKRNGIKYCSSITSMYVPRRGFGYRHSPSTEYSCIDERTIANKQKLAVSGHILCKALPSLPCISEIQFPDKLVANPTDSLFLALRFPPHTSLLTVNRKNVALLHLEDIPHYLYRRSKWKQLNYFKWSQTSVYITTIFHSLALE